MQQMFFSFCMQLEDIICTCNKCSLDSTQEVYSYMQPNNFRLNMQ